MNVRWTRQALDRLADIYVGLSSVDAQRELARQVDRINAELAADPWSLGEGRSDDTRRVWFAGPLIVTFELLPGGVRVVKVSENKPRRAGG